MVHGDQTWAHQFEYQPGDPQPFVQIYLLSMVIFHCQPEDIDNFGPKHVVFFKHLVYRHRPNQTDGREKTQIWC